MSSAARFLQDPGGFLLALLVWIPLAGWIYTTIAWMVEDEIDVALGIVSLMLALVVGYFTVEPPAPWVSPLLFLVAVGTLMAVPAAQAGLRRRAVAALDLDRITEAYEAAEARPDNLSAVLQMARFLHVRGLPGHAIYLMDDALAKMPAALLQDEQRILHAWKLRPPAPEAFDPLPCLRCGQRNEAGRIHCERCGARFLLDHAERRWLPKGSATRRLLVAWIAAALVLVCIPATAALPLPAAAVVALVLAELGVGAFVFWRALAEPAGGRA